MDETFLNQGVVFVEQYEPEQARVLRSVLPLAILFCNVAACLAMLSGTVANVSHLPGPPRPAMLLRVRAMFDVPRSDSYNAIAVDINGFICFSLAWSRNTEPIFCSLLGTFFRFRRATALFTA